jgi:hypothetical protein
MSHLAGVYQEEGVVGHYMFSARYQQPIATQFRSFEFPRPLTPPRKARRTCSSIHKYQIVQHKESRTPKAIQTLQKVRLSLSPRVFIYLSRRSQDLFCHICNFSFFRCQIRRRLTTLGGERNLLNAFKCGFSLSDFFSRQWSIKLLGSVKQVPESN